MMKYDELDELWREVRDIVQETGIKTIPMEKKCKKSKIAVWGGLTNSCGKKRSEKQRRKGKIFPFESSSKERQEEIRKPSSAINTKK